MSKRARNIFLIIISIQIISILSFSFSQEIILHTGQEIILETSPVDPRDIFRGEYVVLRYNISTLSTDQCCFKSFAQKERQEIHNGDKIYVQLQPNDETWIAINASKSKTANNNPETITIKGKITEIKNRCYDNIPEGRCYAEEYSLEYGIESYFVPEGQGKAIEQTKDLKVIARVNSRGIAKINNLLVNGEIWK